MKVNKFICPACKQKTGVMILYGEPTAISFEMAERDEIALGGDGGGAERQCTTCGHEWMIKRRGNTEVAA